MVDELKKKIRNLFICRICLWVIAAGVSIYWIVLSFWLYEVGIHDVHEYADYLRPRLYAGLLIAFACIAVSFWLRHISEGFKKQIKDIDTEKQI